MFLSRLVTSAHQPPFPPEYQIKFVVYKLYPSVARLPSKPGGLPMELVNFFASRFFIDVVAYELYGDGTRFTIGDYTLLHIFDSAGFTV